MLRRGCAGHHFILARLRHSGARRLTQTLGLMKIRYAILHISICGLVGAIFSATTPMKWLAASLLTSAALQINGALAAYEDALPGGFDNPEGTETPDFTKGAGAAKYWLKSLALVFGLAVIGLWVQFQ